MDAAVKMRWRFALGAGTLLGIGFVLPQLWWLCFFGFVPFFAGIRGTISHRQAFLFGWITGCVLYGLGLFCLWWQVLPLDWVGFLATWFEVLLVAVGWAGAAAAFALLTGAFGVFVRLTGRGWRDYFYLPAAWVLCEWAGAWFISMLYAGPGVRLGPDFSIAFLGNLLAHDDVLLQAAWLGGVYLLSAIAVVLGVALYNLSRADSRGRKKFFVAFGLLLLLWVGGQVALRYVPAYAGLQPVRIAAMALSQPPVLVSSPESDRAQYAIMRSLLPQTSGASLVVLPEGSDFFQTLEAVTLTDPHRALGELFGTLSTPIVVDSQSLYDPGHEIRGRLEFYPEPDGSAAFRYKQMLLPGGEYMPFIFKPFFALVGKDDALGNVLARRAFVAATSSAPVPAGGVLVGALFCAEAMSPVLYASLAGQGAQVFVNVSSQSWFHGSRSVAAQMESAAKIRAVESRRWYVQASDASPAFVLDPFGKVATSSAWGQAGVISADVYPRDEKTPYVLWGAWIPLMLALLLCTAYPGLRRLW